MQQRLSQSVASPGASLQGRIRELAQELKSAEIRRLNRREGEARDSARLTRIIIIGGSALALLCVGLALVAIRRDIAGRARAEAELNQFFDSSVDLFVISSGDGTSTRSRVTRPVLVALPRADQFSRQMARSACQK